MRQALTTFEATLVFDGDEVEGAVTRDGTPYRTFRNVEIDTGYEIVSRTVMAFGDAVDATEPLLHPGRPVRLRVSDNGRVFKVAGTA